MEVAKERSGWRDEKISARHREWGWDCPAVDIDFLMLEYDNGEPIAFVEYKHERAKLAYPSHPSYRALVNLGNRAKIPVLACRYKDDLSSFIVVPLNIHAAKYLPARKTMSEAEYVSFLYRLRGREAPNSVMAAIKERSGKK